MKKLTHDIHICYRILFTYHYMNNNTEKFSFVSAALYATQNVFFYK